MGAYDYADYRAFIFFWGGYEVFAPLGGIPEVVARRITELTEVTELTN